jgi:hypothetical protein
MRKIGLIESADSRLTGWMIPNVHRPRLLFNGSSYAAGDLASRMTSATAPDLPASVPSAPDLLKDERDRKVLRVLSAAGELGKPQTRNFGSVIASAGSSRSMKSGREKGSKSHLRFGIFTAVAGFLSAHDLLEQAGSFVERSYSLMFESTRARARSLRIGIGSCLRCCSSRVAACPPDIFTASSPPAA